MTGGAAGAPFAAGAIVVVYLSEPRGKMWGVLRHLDAAGVTIEGIDLRSFDEVLRGVASKEIHPADLSLAYFPIGRVEKILADRGSVEVPSLADQFAARAGVGLAEFLKG